VPLSVLCETTTLLAYLMQGEKRGMVPEEDLTSKLGIVAKTVLALRAFAEGLRRSERWPLDRSTSGDVLTAAQRLASVVRS
jgi:hypothetical protein